MFWHCQLMHHSQISYFYNYQNCKARIRTNDRIRYVRISGVINEWLTKIYRIECSVIIIPSSNFEYGLDRRHREAYISRKNKCHKSILQYQQIIPVIRCCFSFVGIVPGASTKRKVSRHHCNGQFAKRGHWLVKF